MCGGERGGHGHARVATALAAVLFAAGPAATMGPRGPTARAMPTLALALGFCLAVIGGALAATRTLEPEASEALVIAGLVIAVIACLGALGGLRPRLRAGALVVAVLVAGLARGWSAQISPVTDWAREPALIAASELILLEIEAASEPGPRCRVRAHTVDGPRIRVHLSLPGARCPLSAGQRLWARARELRAAGYGHGVPGSMHPHELSRRLGVHGVHELDAVWTVSRGRPRFVQRYWAAVAALRSHAWLGSRDSDARGLVVAVTLGLGSSVPGERRTELRDAGLGHLLAVSGLHVGIAALLLRGLLLRVGLWSGASPRVAAILSCVPVLAYVGLTGASPSAVRAAAMFVLLQGAIAVGRPAHGMTQLFVAAALLLAFRPRWALSPGFQLSVTAMAVIVHPGAEAGLWRQSVTVVWATTPLALWHFGSASLYGILANCLAIPVFTLWIVPLGLLGVVALPWVGSQALDPAALGAEVVLDVAALFARLPVLSPRVLVGLAGVLLIVRGVARYRGSAAEAWAHRCGVPPIAAAVAVIVTGTTLMISDTAGRDLQVPGFRDRAISWVAIGGTREVAVVAPVTLTGDDLELTAVCIRDPLLSASRWPRLLAALGVDRVARVDTSEIDEPPHVLELRAHLRRAGLLADDDEEPAGCRFPARDDARAAIKRCRAQAERRGLRGPVTALARGHAIACFFAFQWVDMHSDLGPSAGTQGDQ